MNKSAIATPDEATAESPAVSHAAPRHEWPWIALVCVILVGAGGARYWRDWQFQSITRHSEVSPFPLGEISDELGAWRVVQGSERKLEDDIAQIAGAADHLERTYVNEKSGQMATVLILYGLASRVWPHVPDVCYPATGFRQATPAEDLDIPIRDGTATARFRHQSFAKSLAGRRDYREVYHSFRHAGEWGLDQGQNWKLFRYHPGMYKVQVQLQGLSTDLEKENESVHQLLSSLVGEVERRAVTKS